MATAEKNDVDISKLFEYGDKFVLQSASGKTHTVYIRLVGDAELNRARVFALRKSAELREKLKDPNSDEHIAYVPKVGTVDKNILVNTALTLTVQPFTREALRDLDPIPLPAELKGDSTLEEQEKHQKEIDEYPQKRSLQIQNYVTRRVEEETKSLQELSDEELLKHYTKLVINDLCEQEMLTKYQEMCVYFSTYEDSKYKRKSFTTFSDFENAPTFIKEQLIEAYNSLDISSEQLKK